MVDLTRKIGAVSAAQGGFSSRGSRSGLTYQVVTPKVSPNPVPYSYDGAWGLGWLYMAATISSSLYDSWTLTAISGNGSASASFTMDMGSVANQPEGLTVYPVSGDTMLIVFRWQVNKGSSGNAGDSSQIHITSDLALVWFGIGKKGFLVSRTAASVVDIPSSLGVVSLAGSWPVGGWDGSQAESQINVSGVEGWANVNSFKNRTDNPEFGTGATAYSETNDGTQYRISLAADSGFARAVDESASINSADKGSVWFPNYSSWDSRPFKLESKPSGGGWGAFGDPVALSSSPISVGDPGWLNVDIVTERFLCLISVPYSDRRAWFQSEHGLTIS